MKRVTLFLAAMAVSSQVAEAIFFGVGITDPSGNTIAGADATQTGAIFGLGFLAASLGLLIADSQRPPTTTVIRRPVRGRGRGRGRGRRSTDQELRNAIFDADDAELLDFVFKKLDTTTDCYKRLLCDVGAGADFVASKPIADLIQATIQEDDLVTLSNKGKSALNDLHTSISMGRAFGDVTSCEQIFANCPYTGAQLDKLIAMGKA